MVQTIHTRVEKTSVRSYCQTSDDKHSSRAEQLLKTWSTASHDQPIYTFYIGKYMLFKVLQPAWTLTYCLFVLFIYFFFTWYWFYFLFFGSNVFLCLMQRFGFYSCNTKNPATLVMCLTFHMMKTWIQMFWILPSDHSPHRLTYLIHVWCSSTGHTVSLRSPWSCGPDSPCARCWWPAWSAWPPV